MKDLQFFRHNDGKIIIGYEGAIKYFDDNYFDDSFEEVTEEEYNDALHENDGVDEKWFSHTLKHGVSKIRNMVKLNHGSGNKGENKWGNKFAKYRSNEMKECCLKVLDELKVEVFKIIKWSHNHGNNDELISKRQISNIIDSLKNEESKKQ